MTARELRLRQRIDQLTDERDEARRLLRRQYDRVATLQQHLAQARACALQAQLERAEIRARYLAGTAKEAA